MKVAMVIVSVLFINKCLSNNLIHACGFSAENDFSGWSVNPYKAFSEVEFKEETVAFHVKDGGDYTLLLTRKISEMKTYSQLDFNVRFDKIQNCILNNVDVFVSPDGKNWTATETDANGLHKIIADDPSFEHVRIAANISFQSNGFIECTYFSVEGNDPVSLVSEDEIPVETAEDFFVFCFNRSVNIETQSEGAYEILFTNLAGQIVYRESSVGSTRIVAELPDGMYIVSVVQDGVLVKTKKVIFQDDH